MNPEETHTQDKTLKVAVVGGGICGLALAIGLTKAGIDVDIYEAAPKFGEVGAGVGLDPNAIRVLRELEILEDVVASVHPEVLAPRPLRFVCGLGEHELIYDVTRKKLAPFLFLVYCPVTPVYGGLCIHRVTFLEALVHLVDPSKTYFNKRCTGLRAGVCHGIQLIFADGTSAEADVVIGADGIRSAVRTFVVEGSVNKGGTTEGRPRGIHKHTRVSRTDPRRATEECRRADRPERAATLLHWARKGIFPFLRFRVARLLQPPYLPADPQFIIAFPIKQGTVVNVVAFVCDRSIAWSERPLPAGKQWVTPRTTEELLETYAGWGCDAQLLLGCLPRPSVWAVHAVDPPLESYVRGRVALIGDAAHGMLPHLGAGAGQGLEDVLVLVRLLAHPQMRVGNVECDVLKTYDAVRRPRANMVLAESTKMEDIYAGFGPSGSSVEGIRADLEGRWDKVWHHDILADVDAAVARLMEDGIFEN